MLIRAALRHFAADGFKGASQRAIQRDAGVNPASAHYYFGSKEALYKAVIETFIHEIQEQRVARHAAIPSDLVGKDRLFRILFDYFEPGMAVTDTSDGHAYNRILSRTQAELSGTTVEIFYDIVRPVRSLYLDSLGALFPNASAAELNEALTMGVILMATQGVRRDPEIETASEAARRVTSFATAGFEALLGKPVGP